MPIRRDITCAEELMKIGRDPNYPGNGVYTIRKDIQIASPWVSLPGVQGIELYGEGYWIGPLSAPLFESITDGVIQHVRLELAIDARGGDPSSGLEAVGGLARQGVRMDMDACEAYGSVTGLSHMGGFFGRMIDSDVWGLHNYANVTATAGMVGGVAGEGRGNRYRDCWNHGRIAAMGLDIEEAPGVAGGVIGQETPAMRAHEEDPREPFIEFCTNRGAIEAYSDAGGIVGCVASESDTRSAPFTMLWCGNFGEISCSGSGLRARAGNKRFGGIIGFAQRPCFLTECYNQNKVCGGAFVGGIVGLGQRAPSGEDTPENSCASARGDGAIENCANYDVICLARDDASPCQTDVSECVGGIAGALIGFGNLYSCQNKMTICSDGANAGGLVGLLEDGDVQSCQNEGFVHSSSDSVGGIVGCARSSGSRLKENSQPEEELELEKASEKAFINEAAASEDGRIEELSRIEECENHGEIEGGSKDIGGIAGCLAGGARVERCINWGSVRSASGEHVGGIAGYAFRMAGDLPNAVDNSISLAPHIQGVRGVHRVLGAEREMGETRLSGQADRGALLLGDNAFMGGTAYREETVTADDPQLGEDRLHGRSVSSAIAAAESIREMKRGAS
ncbi:MAG: hypothetical protein LBS72_08320 [Oscillospiraceae bacterium]|nr:hypothetical protein [Oscillospiraceae bacterium]